jgi:hypothetical protein
MYNLFSAFPGIHSGEATSVVPMALANLPRNEFRGNNMGRADGTGKPPAIVDMSEQVP